MTKAPGHRLDVLAALLSALLSLGIGYVVLELILLGMNLAWTTIPSNWGSAPAWYLIAVLLLAAILVYVIRRFLGDSGHSPLEGITIKALTPRQYLDAILAIAVSLIGGIVLGPEVALVSTGAVIGGLIARLMHVGESRRVIAAGAGGAILALLIGPLLSGSLTLNDTDGPIRITGVAWAIPIAITVTVLILIIRWAAGRLTLVTGPQPRAAALLIAGLVIAGCAIAFQSWTGEAHTLIVTSGEEYIADLTTLDETSTLLALIVLKSIAYAVSLGSGFRGGPFFPAMFIGAAVGMLLASMLPAGPAPAAGVAVGVSAAVIATASMDWRVAVVLAVVIAVVLGGWSLIPAAVIGGLAGWGIRRMMPAVIRRGPRRSAPR